MKDLSVVIPTYKNPHGLRTSVEVLCAYLRQQTQQFEIVIVDDASSDETKDVIASLCAQFVEVQGLILQQNVGQQNATLAGLRQCRFNHIVTLDDDQHYALVDIDAMYRVLESLILQSDRCAIIYLKPPHNLNKRPFYRDFGTVFKEKCFQWLLKKPRGMQLTSQRMMNRACREFICQDRSQRVYISARALMNKPRLNQVISQYQLPEDAALGQNTPMSRYKFHMLTHLLTVAMMNYGPTRLITKREAIDQDDQYVIEKCFGERAR